MNYRTEAGLYHPVKRSLKPSPAHIVYRRFKSAAGAIRFAIEELPRSLLVAAALEVGDHRYDAQQIRKLYDASAYPLKRHSRR